MSNKPVKLINRPLRTSKMKKKRGITDVTKDVKTVMSVDQLSRQPRPITSAQSAAAKRLTKDALRVAVGSGAYNTIQAALKKPYKPTKVKRVNLNNVKPKKKK